MTFSSILCRISVLWLFVPIIKKDAILIDFLSKEVTENCFLLKVYGKYFSQRPYSQGRVRKSRKKSWTSLKSRLFEKGVFSILGLKFYTTFQSGYTETCAHSHINFLRADQRSMTHAYGIWLIHTWHDSFIYLTHSYVKWLIHMWFDSFIVTWLIYLWHDSFICDMTHSYVTWRIYMWHDSIIYD